jgi:UDP-N-acetylmuramate dehydrogenase
MNIEENVSLAAYSTMRLGGLARYLADVTSEQQLEELVRWAKSGNLPVIMVGRGSNIVWKDEGFQGLRAYDTALNGFVQLQNHDCNFSYRSSRFKTTDKHRFLIVSITVTLRKTNPVPPFYDSLQKYLDENGIHKYSPKTIRQAVIAIRQSKLPDPEKVANNGSFFTNPIVENGKFEELKARYPGIAGWPAKEGHTKLAAGWLVEQAGFKGVRDDQTGMATWPAQALVLVNEHAKTTADLLVFRQKILDKVQEMFGVTLAQEPELLP